MMMWFIWKNYSFIFFIWFYEDEYFKMKGNRFMIFFLVRIFWKVMYVIWEGMNVSCYEGYIFLGGLLFFFMC